MKSLKVWGLKQISWTKISLLGLGLQVLACGADKDIEDYRREKLADELNSVSWMSGVYEGKIDSQATQKSLGSIHLQLDPSTRVISGADSVTNAQQLVLNVKVKILGEKENYLNFTDGYVDTKSGKFQVVMPIKWPTGETSQIEISGSFVEPVLKGKIEALGYPEMSGVFAAQKSSDPQTKFELSKASLYSSPPGTPVKKWRSPWPSEKQTADDWVDLFYFPENTSSDLEFLKVFSPLRYFDVMMNVGDVVNLVFSNARWDQRSGRLYAKAKLAESNGAERIGILDCIAVNLDQVDSGLNCHYVNGFSGRIYELKFR